MKRSILAAAAIAAAIGVAPAFAHAQCAGCDADFNKKDRAEVARQEKEQKDRAEKQQLKEALGNGMARDAAEKAEKHNERNEKALKDVDKN